jgi:hypothetical protein
MWMCVKVIAGSRASMYEKVVIAQPNYRKTDLDYYIRKETEKTQPVA